MNIAIIVLAAFAPCVFWLWIIYRTDKYRHEPKLLMIRTFLYGLAIALPVALIETLLYPHSLSQDFTSLSSAAYVAFVVAGATEEGAKFMVVRGSVYKSRIFEEPMDGLVYSAAVALGFASLENIFYLFSFGWQLILVRGLFSNLAHVLFSALWGFPLALHKLGFLKSRFAVWTGLLSAVVAHGIFDFLFFTQSLFTLLVVPFFIGMVVLFILMIRRANKISIYRGVHLNSKAD